MEFIKKHKLTSFIIFIYIVVIAFAYFVYKLLMGSNGLPVYGDRLDGIENVPITEEQYDKMKDELYKNDIVIALSEPRLRGKILSLVITVGDNAALNDSKKLVDIVKNSLTEEQNNFYDIEVFLNKEYKCSLQATGKIDEDGNFTSDVMITFDTDLSKNKNAKDYGISNQDQVDYNKKQDYTITEDGTYTIYGFTKDDLGESKCNIKITRKKTDAENPVETVTSSVEEKFPAIGYKRKGTSDFVWTKDR